MGSDVKIATFWKKYLQPFQNNCTCLHAILFNHVYFFAIGPPAIHTRPAPWWGIDLAAGSMRVEVDGASTSFANGRDIFHELIANPS
ncbi:hypothetical protein [Variovorax boronicumulans]|uniref:hypothetical protein n=1 Tax=Variovorax boronicumulans TaxID=436515 RepID=UPI0033914207